MKEKNKIKIVIVDSGIDCVSEIRKKWNIKKKYCFRNGEIYEDKRSNDVLGHGTAVFSALYCEDIAEYYVIKVFDDSESISEDTLKDVLEYIYMNIDCDIVHLSCGITMCEDIKSLEDICCRIEKKGTIIVAAFDNYGAMSYPAVFECVIGVDIDVTITNRNIYHFVEGKRIDIRAIGVEQRLPWLNGKHEYVSGASFAAPYITKKITIYLYNMGEKQNVRIWLRQNANKIYDFKSKYKEKKMFTINKAILFPCNKEIENIVRNSENVNFLIKGVYDKNEMGKIGKKLLNNSDFSIMNINGLNWEDDFDTIILGHLDYYELFFPGIKQSLVNTAKAYKKNVFMFDDKNINKKNIDDDSVFVPIITENTFEKNCFGKLYEIAKPVIAILGTSPKQGKLSMQLFLKRMFESDGYKTGYLGTEPSTLLYCGDECYPMGENSMVKVEGNKAVQAVNYLMHKIEKKNPDVILAGGQSQTIAYNYSNIGCHTIPQHEYLVGVMPDVIILCVNIFDDFDYIQRTINYIEAVTEGKTICLMLCPLARNLKWSVLGNRQYMESEKKIMEYKNRMEDYFSCPVYILFSDEQMRLAYRDIINYLIEK